MASRTRRKLLHNILRQDLAFFDATAPAHLVKVLQVLLYMCPHTAIYVPSYYCVCAFILLYVSHCASASRRSPQVAHTTLCVFILTLLHTCPHTTIYVSSWYYVCVRIQLCPHTYTIVHYVSSYYFTCPSYSYYYTHTHTHTHTRTHTQQQ